MKLRFTEAQIIGILREFRARPIRPRTRFEMDWPHEESSSAP